MNTINIKSVVPLADHTTRVSFTSDAFAFFRGIVTHKMLIF